MSARDGGAMPALKAPRPFRFVAVALLVPALLAALVVWLHTEYARSDRLRQDAVAAAARQSDRAALLSLLKDVETAQRGYLLTGDAAFLAPFAPARAEIDARLRRSDAEGPRLDAIRGLTAQKLAELNRTIRLYRAGRVSAVLRSVRAGEGKRLMDRLRVAIAAAERAEQARAAAQTASYLAHRARVQTTMLGIVVGLVLTVCAVLFVLWRMRRDRHVMLVDALESARRHATILDSTIDAILIVNPSGTVETMNAAATRLTGYTAAELERRDVSVILDIAPGHGSFHKRVGLADGMLRQSRLPDRMARHRDGREIAVDVALGVMAMPSGEHLVVSLHDITERKRIERVKDDLVSTVSHELRIPLTAVVGALGLLRAGAATDLSAQAARLVEIAETNSRRLIRLIDDMLDIDHIESGKLTLDRTPIDLRDVVAQACEGSEGLARAKAVRLACAPADAPIVVSGDADRLVQVLANLLSNAIRAAPAGSTVDIRAESADGRASLFVEDRGAGIPVEFRSRIFGRFERAGYGDAATGTGLGLAISREIATRHDGRIWFEDRAGGGTRFAVSLPLFAAAAAHDTAPAFSPTSASLAQ